MPEWRQRFFGWLFCRRKGCKKKTCLAFQVWLRTFLEACCMMIVTFFGGSAASEAASDVAAEAADKCGQSAAARQAQRRAMVDLD